MRNTWSYQKGNPEEVPATPVMAEASSHQEEEVLLNSVSPAYKKGESYEEVKSFVIIFSGGRETELAYLKPVRNEMLFPNIKIDVFVEDEFDKQDEELLFKPRIFDFAIKKIKEDYLSGASPEMPDSYYLITDVDHFKEAIIANDEKCKEINLQLIVSNPCFEVWLYYSKHADRFQGFEVPDKNLSHSVKKFVNSSVKGGLNTGKCIFDIKQNIHNAEANYQCDECGFPTLFSTNMFLMAKQVLPYIESGLDAIRRSMEEKRRLYKGKT